MGFCRVVSDDVTSRCSSTSSCCPSYRGRGLGMELVREAVEPGPHADLPWHLGTKRRARAVPAVRVRPARASGRCCADRGPRRPARQPGRPARGHVVRGVDVARDTSIDGTSHPLGMRGDQDPRAHVAVEVPGLGVDLAGEQRRARDRPRTWRAHDLLARGAEPATMSERITSGVTPGLVGHQDRPRPRSSSSSACSAAASDVAWPSRYAALQTNRPSRGEHQRRGRPPPRRGRSRR